MCDNSKGVVSRSDLEHAFTQYLSGFLVAAPNYDQATIARGARGLVDVILATQEMHLPEPGGRPGWLNRGREEEGPE